VGHYLPEGFKDGSPKHVLQPFGTFAFSSLQIGGSPFFVGHGGVWGWFEYHPGSAWLHQPPPQIL